MLNKVHRLTIFTTILSLTSKRASLQPANISFHNTLGLVERGLYAYYAFDFLVKTQS